MVVFRLEEILTNSFWFRPENGAARNWGPKIKRIESKFIGMNIAKKEDFREGQRRAIRGNHKGLVRIRLQCSIVYKWRNYWIWIPAARSSSIRLSASARLISRQAIAFLSKYSKITPFLRAIPNPCVFSGLSKTASLCRLFSLLKQGSHPYALLPSAKASSTYSRIQISKDHKHLKMIDLVLIHVFCCRALHRVQFYRRLVLLWTHRNSKSLRKGYLLTP